MKITSIILSVIAVALIIYNATKIDLDAPFAGDSIVAWITILAALSAIILLQILNVSKKIEKLNKKKS